LFSKKSATTNVALSTSNIVWITEDASTRVKSSSTSAPIFGTSLSLTTCTYTNAVTDVTYWVETESQTITGIKAVATVKTITATASQATLVQKNTEINFLGGKASSP